MALPADLTIRVATVDDTPTILTFIKDLAEYEKLSERSSPTRRGSAPRCSARGRPPRSSSPSSRAQPVGFALFFQSYSTFLGKPGLYLEDLFVRPAARGKGVGRALMSALARIAVERDYGRFEWSVLDWNEPALEFYASLGCRAALGVDHPAPHRRAARRARRALDEASLGRDTAPPAVDRRRAARRPGARPTASRSDTQRRSIGAQPLARPRPRSPRAAARGGSRTSRSRRDQIVATQHVDARDAEPPAQPQHRRDRADRGGLGGAGTRCRGSRSPRWRPVRRARASGSRRRCRRAPSARARRSCRPRAEVARNGISSVMSLSPSATIFEKSRQLGKPVSISCSISSIVMRGIASSLARE